MTAIIRALGPDLGQNCCWCRGCRSHTTPVNMATLFFISTYWLEPVSLFGLSQVQARA
ncbi:hypothetical protein HBH98_134810 [Parastagonospora nodorum]|nr:hypothetical protein HBH98_134810 [Parastagonospora nodorum]KAH4373800.1 hypothetical protein HBH97_125690 [Parastagonospora nodorum]KAH4420935.1 hypothetical protein HBH99_052390 [Parastagonospora nodorum]KAH4899627.1 hypothetical protein HBI80_164920 [Parastagonospora nodorum]KAH5279762.1 hypothetical protein HBI70_079120 [Parastagonospora nodorum]